MLVVFYNTKQVKKKPSFDPFHTLFTASSRIPLNGHFSNIIVFFRRVWPKHLHLRAFISDWIKLLFIRTKRFSLAMTFGRNIPLTLRRHLLIKVWSFLVMLSVTLHVSEPYSQTAFTLAENTLSLVRLDIFLANQTLHDVPCLFER